MSRVVLCTLYSTLLVLVATGQSQAPTSVESSLDRINASADNQATGTVRIYRESDELKVSAEVRKLKSGEYSLRIHEKGDCGDDSKKAGGLLKGGDLGKVTVKEDGWCHLERTLPNLSLDAVNGKAVSIGETPIRVYPRERTPIAGENCGELV